MKVFTKSIFALAATVGLAAAPACQPPFPGVESSQRLSITVTSTKVGSPGARLPLSLTSPATFTVDIAALDPNGIIDRSFTNHYVRASIVPGAVLSVSGPGANGRNALVVDGQAKGLEIAVVESYGDSRIWVEDVGYVPADPLRTHPDGTPWPPECANGIDDNHNGLVDYGVDPGCYAPNDDTEDGGSYSAAVSDILYFEYPRIADVRGINNGGSTPFNNQQVQINTGWIAPNAPGGVVVTGIGSAGFFVTDLGAPASGNPPFPAGYPAGSPPPYSSVYAYTYTAPAIMLPCDRLISFGGTGGDFFGFTEMNYPTWSLEEWDPTVRPCLVPEPTVLTGVELPNGAESGDEGNLSILLSLEASLVRVANVTTATTQTSIHVASLFGPGLVPVIGGVYTPQPNATDCDYNGDGKIDFTAGNPEDLCSTACTSNLECSEFSAYLTESQFNIVVETTCYPDPSSCAPGAQFGSGIVTADASADADFVPTQFRGKPLGAFTGNLNYFSGGNSFTIDARCADDVITDPSQKPLPSSKACVVARNAADQTNAN
jgi:hypothetical protein